MKNALRTMSLFRYVVNTMIKSLRCRYSNHVIRLPLILLLVCILCSSTGNINAQTRTITGTITDLTTSAPILGANVTVKGTTIGAVTNSEGLYEIEASEGQVLSFSFIGYVTEEIIVGSSNVLDVALIEDIAKLDEVVVIGYGVMKKSDITGSVVSVQQDDITAIPTTNALEVLQGKVAGLDLIKNSGQTGSGLQINIRGDRSLKEGLNDPLVIVDGIDYGTNLDINPNEIESIEVLKDASSTAIYGSRGANGVIIITTKRGKGISKVSLNSYYGSSKAVDYPEFFQGTEFIEFAREAHKTNGAWNGPEDDYKALSPYELYDSAHFVDWRDLLLVKGSMENHQLFISGGNEKTSFSLSDFFTREKGIIRLDEFKRYGGKLNIDHKVNKFLEAGVNIAYTYTDRDKRDNPLNMANKYVPVGVPYNEDGSINIYPLNEGTISPLADEQLGVWKDDEITKRFFYSTYLQVNFLNDFTFKSTFGADITDVFEGVFADSYTIRNAGGYNTASTFDYNKTYLQLENTLNYSKSFEEHAIQVLLGNSINYETQTSNFASGSNFPTNTFLYHNLYAAQTEITNSSNFRKTQLVSFFGRIHYNLREKYILQFTLREDGASTLAPDHKWAAFPSASFAWRIGEENFIKAIESISNLKLRISYGTSGKRSIDPYTTQGVYYPSVYTWGDNTLASGYYPGTISNQLLEWEKTATTDIGVDMGLFNNRINLNFDVYKQFTYSLLMDRQLPAHTGYTSIIENIGETENKGFEIALSSLNVKSRDGFTWTTDLTLFANKEQILKLNQSDRDLNNVWFTGYPSKVFFSYEKEGIWQREDSLLAASYGFRPGDIRIKDYNMDGVISEADFVVVGQKRPEWSGGMKNSFKFKGIDLSVFIFARMGQTIDYEGYHWDSYWYEGRAAGVKVDYWTYDNPTNDFPRPDRKATYKTENIALRYVDGSFVKIRDISLGYTLPNTVLEKIKFEKIRFYTTLKNYFMLYNNIPGYDSERSGDLSYPMTKQWLFGINVDF